MKKHLTIKELPITERPYEKCLKYGTSKLSDAELLAVIIRTGTSGLQSIDLARNILNLSNQQGLLCIHQLTAEELMKVNGIGKVKAIQLKCISELAKRLAKGNIEKTPLTSSRDVASCYMEEYRHLSREHVLLLMLNTKKCLIAEKILSKGTVSASSITPREIFVEALNKDAVSIILLHNHPSGDATPSKADIALTKQVKWAGITIGIPLMDHLIIGDGTYTSFKEKGLL